MTRVQGTSAGSVICGGIRGGVTPANIAGIARAGADTFVAGSAIFNQPDYAAVIAEMRSRLASLS